MSSNAQQEPSKVNANLKSMAGTAEETLAAAVGATGYQKAGQNLRAEADQEYKAAQAQGYAEGVVDQFTGKKEYATSQRL